MYAGAFVNLKSREDGTALDAAERSGDPELIRMLRATGT